MKLGLKWWTYIHFGREFVIRELEISRQKDGHSCGIHAWKAIGAFFELENHSLPDPKHMFEERLHALIRTAQHHNNQVLTFLTHSQ